MANSNFQIAICEIFNRRIHGYIAGQSSNGIDSHILVKTTFTAEEFMNNEYSEIIENMQQEYNTYPIGYKYHNIIRNYSNIVSSPNYYKVDIVQMFELRGGECIAIVKTYLLKILQRKWRKWFNNRYRIISTN